MEQVQTSTIRKYTPRKEDVVRITVIELPLEYKAGEGLYEWRYMSDKQLMDMLTLKRELMAVIPPHSYYSPEWQATTVVDRLQNFRRVFINTVTGEISS